MDRPLGALTVLLALLVSAPAAAAGSDDPGTPGPPLVGTPVSGATDPADAPELRTDRYLDRLPGDDELHYRLPRAEDGSTFHVAVMFLGAGRSVGEGLRVKTGTTPGDQGCGSSGVFRPTLRESAPLSHVVSYVNPDSYDATVNTESLAGVHYVLVTWHSSVEQPAGRPLEATLALQTSGTPGTGVPSYTEIEGLLPPAAGSRLVDGSLEAPPEDAGTTTAPAEDDEPLPWRVIGLAAAAATVALLALLRLTRRAGRAPGR